MVVLWLSSSVPRHCSSCSAFAAAIWGRWHTLRIRGTPSGRSGPRGWRRPCGAEPDRKWWLSVWGWGGNWGTHVIIEQSPDSYIGDGSLDLATIHDSPYRRQGCNGHLKSRRTITFVRYVWKFSLDIREQQVLKCFQVQTRQGVWIVVWKSLRIFFPRDINFEDGFRQV